MLSFCRSYFYLFWARYKIPREMIIKFDNIHKGKRSLPMIKMLLIKSLFNLPSFQIVIASHELMLCLNS